MRNVGWEEMLRTWAWHRMGDAFRWGDNDCAMLCFEAADLITGRRPGLKSQYSGRWSNQRTALRFQEREQINLEIALNRAGAFRRQGTPVLGDLVLHPHPRLAFVCGQVCVGEMVLSSNEDLGVYFARRADVCAQSGSFVMRLA